MGGWKIIFLALLAVWGISGCGGGGGDDGAQPPAETKLTWDDGSWDDVEWD